jgi:transcriptional regulator with XRE-family HTH domain
MGRPSPLRARRLLRGGRLRDVAHAIGTTDSALSRLERGEAHLVGPVLRALARFYATPPATLVDQMRAWAARTNRPGLGGGGFDVGEPPESAA